MYVRLRCVYHRQYCCIAQYCNDVWRDAKIRTRFVYCRGDWTSAAEQQVLDCFRYLASIAESRRMTGYDVQVSIDKALAKPDTVRRCLQRPTFQHGPQRALYFRHDLTIETSSRCSGPFGLPSVLDVSISYGVGLCQL